MSFTTCLRLVEDYDDENGWNVRHPSFRGIQIIYGDKRIHGCGAMALSGVGFYSPRTRGASRSGNECKAEPTRELGRGSKSEQGDDGRMTRQAILGDDELNGDENESKLRLGGGRVWEWKGENRTWNGC